MTTHSGPPIFPAELWRIILAELFLPDLVSVSAASHLFQALAADSLAEHRALRRRFHCIKQTKFTHDFWYNFLITFLRDPAAASYVEILTVETTNLYMDDDEAWEVDPLPDEIALITKAVETASQWIAEAKKDELLQELLDGKFGNEDAIVTLMVLRLPNLRRLSLPTYCWGGLNFKYLMPIVARIAEATAAPDTGTTTLPLAKLAHYEGLVFDGSESDHGTRKYGVDFESIAPLVALPSLRTMRTPYNNEGGFPWPAALPRSRLERIDIPDGMVPRDVIIAIARNICGPCYITQYTSEYNDPADDVDWTTLTIPFEGAEEADWTIEGDDEEDSDADDSESDTDDSGDLP